MDPQFFLFQAHCRHRRTAIHPALRVHAGFIFSETATLAPSRTIILLPTMLLYDGLFLFLFSTCHCLTCIISCATCGHFVCSLVDGLSLCISLFFPIHSLVLWHVRCPSARCARHCCPLVGRPSCHPRCPRLVKSPWTR